jgi:hypothetical protein
MDGCDTSWSFSIPCDLSDSFLVLCTILLGELWCGGVAMHPQVTLCTPKLRCGHNGRSSVIVETSNMNVDVRVCDNRSYGETVRDRASFPFLEHPC